MAIVKDGGVTHTPQAGIISVPLSECWHADAYRRYCVAMAAYAGLSDPTESQMAEASEAAEKAFEGPMETPAGSPWGVLFKLKMQGLNWNSATFTGISCREAGDIMSRLSAELEAALIAVAVRS